MRYPGRCSPSRAARILGVHVNTVQSWCRSAVSGEPSKLSNVERHPVTGYYWISIEEVRKLKGDGR